jgi:hypothetical protein
MQKKEALHDNEEVEGKALHSKAEAAGAAL